MAGYAASSRIDAVAPRARWRRTPDVPAPRPDAALDVTTTELIGRPLDEILAERVAALREGLAQTTFFLFDPNSWR